MLSQDRGNIDRHASKQTNKEGAAIAVAKEYGIDSGGYKGRPTTGLVCEQLHHCLILLVLVWHNIYEI